MQPTLQPLLRRPFTQASHALNFTPWNRNPPKSPSLALIAATQRLTPEQRLNAFRAHCQLMMELYTAGHQLRAPARRPQT
jgi:hypothetical protein